MNKWIGIGRLTRDPELRRTGTGKAVTSFTLAIDDGYGENKTTEFVDIVAWEKLAETCANYLRKGSKAAVEGKLKRRSYEKDGRKVYVWEVVANTVEFLDSKSENSGGGYSANGYGAKPATGGIPADFSVIDDDDAQLPF